jgi:ABC-2 type transport system ATP-binding protein
VTDQNIIELTGLSKTYGSFTAVDNLTLTVKKGEVYGLLGPNGAGKSTTILMMLGLTEPTSGTAYICSINSTTNPIEVRKRTGYLPEDVGFYDDYTGLENLIYTALLNGKTINEALSSAQKLMGIVGLSEETGKKAGKYSRGMRQRLGLADVLIKDPDVIILDEPTLGIDPKGVKEFLGLIRKLSKDEGHTVLLSSHHLHQVQEVCDRVGLFVGGRLIANGNVNDLSNELFANEPFKLEAGISFPANDQAVTSGGSSGSQRLREAIMSISGVSSLSLEEDLLQVGCSSGNTNEIIKAIVDSGAVVKYLNKKEYGLNDIYHRYFEGA